MKSSGDVSAKISDFRVKEIILRVTANESGKVTVSSSYYPNWHAYSDKEELPVIKDDIFTQVVLPPKESPYDVVLVFEDSKLEWFCKWLSLISWIIVVPTILFMRWRRL